MRQTVSPPSCLTKTILPPPCLTGKNPNHANLYLPPFHVSLKVSHLGSFLRYMTPSKSISVFGQIPAPKVIVN